MRSRWFPHGFPVTRTVALLVAVLVSLAPAAHAQSARSNSRVPTPPPKPGADIFPLSTLWTVTLDAPPAIAPAYDNDRAYVALKAPASTDGDGQAQTSQIVAIALGEGSKKWSREFRDASSLAAGDGLVFASAAASINAFDRENGEPRWQLALDAPLAAPLAYEGGWLVAATQGSDAFGVRARDGAKAWQVHLPSPAAGEPAIVGDAVYLPLSDSRVVRLTVDTGAIVWNREILSRPTTIFAAADRVFAGTSKEWFYALRPDTGRVLWRARVGAPVVGRPSVAGSTVYFLALDDLLRALDRSGGSLRWRQLLAKRARFGPFPAGDILFVSGLSATIQAYDTIKGASAGSFDAPEDLFVPLHLVPGVVAADFLLVALTGEGQMLAIRPQSLVPEAFALSPRLAWLAGWPRWRW